MALSLKNVQEMIQAGLAAAEGMGVQISIAVADSGGYLIAVARMDGAPLLSPEIAHGKAAAAALFRRSGKELGERWAPGAPVPVAMAIRTGGRFVPSQGGLPIWASDQVIGGVGASGASSQQDEDAARAALDAMPPPA